MRLITLTTLFFLSNILLSQTTTFLKNFNQKLFSVIQTNDEKYIVTSSERIMKLGKSGYIEWEAIENQNNKNIKNLYPIELDNGEIITGASFDSLDGNGYSYFIKFSSNGQEILRTEYHK
ncbi:MAG: hypothetical protein GXO87_14850, partial [Chlorobi bacterium]|nr:hypothetical protein [Chlorobiota bacterium]